MLTRAEAVTVLEKIGSILTHLPTQESKSRIKRLREFRVPQFRLRVEQMRVYYSVEQNVVTVHAVVTKETAAKWLEQFGEK